MAKGTIDQDLIRQLANLLDETKLTEIEVEQDGTRVRVARAGVAAAVPAPVAAAPQAAPAVEAAPAAHDPSKTVTSPMVGTVYLAPEPGAAAFVQPGDQVQEGQTLFIVEAMKVMNPIAAPRGGRVKQILVNDGEPVEYGEPLLILE
ncbi:MAG: acetyl-CoA carboxylase biotin carboxyl carrier protein [Alphaproteobacteria bacterium]|nr:acetyl-CoA carboxylase biotin carboxyl carrier protein [Alphaproteobacteria bacterium]MDX5368188.1 acetyl-CoA carboxylase biotin carboxyl carrier protein [Alphaproteobacteria bacterium]MDX5463004.1 acetyl-CoA carboxylase biotin carboxyl carrier protein [Alphaproteobacteria bacterium]